MARLRSRHAQEQNGDGQKRDGISKLTLDKFCPRCFRPGVILDPSTNRFTCTRCGVELEVSPFADGRLGSPFSRSIPGGGQEYALPSIIDYNLGTDPNRTIVELRYRCSVKISGREDDPEQGFAAREEQSRPYLEALGHTHYAKLGGTGGDDEYTKKALRVLSSKIRYVPLPQPSYLWTSRLGKEVRRCVRCLEGPEHLSKMADEVISDGFEWMVDELRLRLKREQSSVCLGTMVDEVIKDAIGSVAGGNMALAALNRAKEVEEP